MSEGFQILPAPSAIRSVGSVDHCEIGRDVADLVTFVSNRLFDIVSREQKSLSLCGKKKPDAAHAVPAPSPGHGETVIQCDFSPSLTQFFKHPAVANRSRHCIQRESAGYDNPPEPSLIEPHNGSGVVCVTVCEKEIINILNLFVRQKWS